MTMPTARDFTAADVLRIARENLAEQAHAARFELTYSPYQWSDTEAQRAYVGLYDQVNLYSPAPRTVVARVSGGDRRARRIHGAGIASTVLDNLPADFPDSGELRTERNRAILTW